MNNLSRAVAIFQSCGFIDAYGKCDALGIPNAVQLRAKEIVDGRREVDMIVTGVHGSREHGWPDHAYALRRSLLAQRGLEA